MDDETLRRIGELEAAVDALINAVNLLNENDQALLAGIRDMAQQVSGQPAEIIIERSH